MSGILGFAMKAASEADSNTLIENMYSQGLIDEKLFESLPDKTYDKVSLGALIDKLEEQWPFSEEYKTELKEEYVLLHARGYKGTSVNKVVKNIR